MGSPKIPISTGESERTMRKWSPTMAAHVGHIGETTACLSSASWAGVFWQLLGSLEWHVSLPVTGTPLNRGGLWVSMKKEREREKEEEWPDLAKWKTQRRRKSELERERERDEIKWPLIGRI